jgi:hypothetical protein
MYQQMPPPQQPFQAPLQQPFQLSPQQIEAQRGTGVEKQNQIAAMQAPTPAKRGGIMKGYK